MLSVMPDESDDTSAPPAGQEYANEFARDLRNLRDRFGWSIEEAAAKADIAPKTWGRLEDGKPVRKGSLAKLDTLFGLKPGTVVALYHDRRSLAGTVQEASDDDQSALAAGSLSHRAMISRLLNELLPYLDDERITAAVRGLAPLGFAGITNDWNDLFDENGMLTIPRNPKVRRWSIDPPT